MFAGREVFIVGKLSMKSIRTMLKGLTLEDLREWVGTKIYRSALYAGGLARGCSGPKSTARSTGRAENGKIFGHLQQIWQSIAEHLIGQVKPKAYQEAAGYLRQMHKVYEKTGRVAEWKTLLIRLRTQHKAKRRLIEVLDGLEHNRKLIG